MLHRLNMVSVPCSKYNIFSQDRVPPHCILKTYKQRPWLFTAIQIGLLEVRSVVVVEIASLQWEKNCCLTLLKCGLFKSQNRFFFLKKPSLSCNNIIPLNMLLNLVTDLSHRQIMIFE